MSIIVAFDSLIYSLSETPTSALPKYLSLLRWFDPPSCVLSSAKHLFSIQESSTYHLGSQCCYECWVQNKSSMFSRRLRKQQVYELSRTLVSRLEAPFFVNDSNTEGMVFPVPTCILQNGLFSLLYWTSGVSEAYRVHCVFVLENFLARQSVYLLAVLAGDEECELEDWKPPSVRPCWFMEREIMLVT